MGSIANMQYTYIPKCCNVFNTFTCVCMHLIITKKLISPFRLLNNDNEKPWIQNIYRLTTCTYLVLHTWSSN
jgi:hypothetical protein